MHKILVPLLSLFLSIVVSAEEASISRNSNLRFAPSTGARIIGHLKAGLQITIISKYPRLGYVRVETAEGDTGWVLQRNVSPSVSNTTPEHNQVSNEPPANRAGDEEIYPKPLLTPGKADPSVTQDNIAKNICKKGWSTESVRPADSVTEKIKTEAMKAYGFTDAANHYELDHLLSLQNGGCPDCIENLWPEAYGDHKHSMTQNQRVLWNKRHPGSTAVLPGAVEKDVVENHIHDEICFGIPNAKMSNYAKEYPPALSITLKRGQEILARDWYECYRNMLNGNEPCR